MAKWRIKEISDLCDVSTRMLRHYDKIGLLTLSYRFANGYRGYTESDLAKLQQIIALKCLGFKLETIKAILSSHDNVYAHLKAQSKILQHQVCQAKQINGLLDTVLQRLSPSDTPNWQDLTQLIARYQQMGNLRETLKSGWAGQALNEQQFEEYLALYEMFPDEFSQRDEIIKQINNNELGEPTSDEGRRVAQFMLDLGRKTKQAFSKQVKFSSSVMKSIQSGQLNQLEITPEGIVWLNKAMLGYWMQRWDSLYDDIVNHLDDDPSSDEGRKLAHQWTNSIDEYFSVGSRVFLTGMLLWNDIARQHAMLEKEDMTMTPKEMADKYHTKLLFNPEASSWISQALEIHTS